LNVIGLKATASAYININLVHGSWEMYKSLQLVLESCSALDLEAKCLGGVDEAYTTVYEELRPTFGHEAVAKLVELGKMLG